MSKKQFNIRLEEDIINKLKEVAEEDSRETGYNITVTDVIEKAIKNLLDDKKKS